MHKTLLIFGLFLGLMFSCPALLHAQDADVVHQSDRFWRPAQAENLLQWMRRAGDDAIAIPEPVMANLRTAIHSQDREHLTQVADAAALMLLRAYHGQCCGAGLPRSWHIAQDIPDAELRGRIDNALATGHVDLMLRANRPNHPHYRALAQAYVSEPDAIRREVLALNLARWRSLPLPRSGRYLIVNAAAQELTLWDGRMPAGGWRVIVGKQSSPTPVFAAEVSGVVINPWWEIPASIAAEGIGAFVRRSPAAARERGYIYSNGRYRQMPGDNNALGRMKLVMPNPYSVFLHDTSNRELFDNEDRLLSHGCVRVDRALQFAATLLDADGWEQSDVDAAVEAGETVTLPLSRNIPVFVAYFTAVPGSFGRIDYLPDVYGRDGGLTIAQAVAETECSAAAA